MLTTLRLRNFRCFDELACALHPQVNLFLGANAQGKTTILEAICVLMRLQSPRTNHSEEMVQFQRSGFAVAGNLQGEELQHAFSNGRRRLMHDGTVLRAKEYLANGGLVVWIANDDLDLVRGSGTVRRRYLDFVASQVYVEYRPALKAYEKALRTRNFLLKRDAVPEWKQIEAYTGPLVEHGMVLINCRRKLIQALEPWAADAQKHMSARDESLSLAYAAGVEGDFAEALNNAREEELRKRVTLYGPHRDELEMRINGMPAAQFGSEGQQRTLALALKLSQSKLIETLNDALPILLLDDVFGELDPARRNALMTYLPAGAQKCITTTNADWVANEFEIHQRYRVVNGAVEDA